MKKIVLLFTIVLGILSSCSNNKKVAQIAEDYVKENICPLIGKKNGECDITTYKKDVVFIKNAEDTKFINLNTKIANEYYESTTGTKMGTRFDEYAIFLLQDASRRAIDEAEKLKKEFYIIPVYINYEVQYYDEEDEEEGFKMHDSEKLYIILNKELKVLNKVITSEHVEKLMNNRDLDIKLWKFLKELY